MTSNQSASARPQKTDATQTQPTQTQSNPTQTTIQLPPLEATIVSINQFGFGFKDNFGTYAYRVDQDTKFWKNFTEQPPQPFVIGDQIIAEFKTSKKLGTVIEELTDPTTYRWLKDNRKNVQLGKLIAGKPGSIQFQFADGTRFNYLTNEKSRVLINNKLSGIKDLKVGNTYWVQPRTTPSLKTSVELLTDTLHKELDTNVKNNILFGTLQAFDSEKSTLTITDAQGTEWRLKLDDNVNFFKNGGVVDSTALQTNLAIRIRFHAESSGLKVAEAIYFFSPS